MEKKTLPTGTGIQRTGASNPSRRKGERAPMSLTSLPCCFATWRFFQWKAKRVPPILSAKWTASPPWPLGGHQALFCTFQQTYYPFSWASSPIGANNQIENSWTTATPLPQISRSCRTTHNTTSKYKKKHTTPPSCHLPQAPQSLSRCVVMVVLRLQQIVGELLQHIFSDSFCLVVFMKVIFGGYIKCFQSFWQEQQNTILFSMGLVHDVIKLEKKVRSKQKNLKIQIFVVIM